MTILNVRHTTVYRYRRPIRLENHRLMLRPRDSHDLRLIRTSLNFLPGASVRWIHDGSAFRSRLHRSPNCGSKASCSWKPMWWSGRDPRSLRRRRAIRSSIRRTTASISAGCLSATTPIRPPLIREGPHEGHPSTTCAHSHLLLAERGVGTTSASGVIPFRNLKRSLPVERTRVVFSAMMDL